MKEKQPLLVIPLTFYHSCPKLLDDATSIGSQGCPLFVEFVKGISIGIKHCWVQFPERRDWHNIVAMLVSILHLVSIAGSVILPSMSSGNTPPFVKACDFCLCWMLWIAAVGSGFIG